MEAKVQLNERVVNIWPDDMNLRKKYGPEVFDILKKSYESIGGIKGNGFTSVEDMIQNIPFWKIVVRGDEVTAAAMYKDKIGRKRVAAGQNGTPQGKMDWKMISHPEVNRSYHEISKAPLAIEVKSKPNLIDYCMPFEKVVSLNKPGEIRRPPSNDEEILKYPQLKDYFYQRNINGHWHTKITVGDINKPISKY
ncbi:MAG: hypothetical protein ABIP51_16680 [Bacteroidia bacterium]